MGMLVVMAAAAFIVGPFITIWCLNTLFTLGIAYTFKTWLAMLGLQILIKGNFKYKENKNV